MHYIVDGYNLLFYLFGSSSSDFQAQRQSLIQSMNTKIEYLGLNVTLVFDSHLSPGEGSRSHYHHLEVLFTPEGVTADDFIISNLKLSRDASKKVLITNDKELAQRARHLLASTQNIDYFLNWLDKRYSNIKRGKSKPLVKFKSSIEENPNTKILSKHTPRLKSPLSSSSLIPLPSSKKDIKSEPSPTPAESPPLVAKPTVETEGSLEYYLSVFQSGHEAILKAEEAAKIEKKKQKKRKKK
jgi:predicted RNA-binding protein with PIN domain